MNLCGGGETLIPAQVVDIVFELLKAGHFVTIISNGTLSQRFDQLIAFPEEYKERLMVKFSFQYLELKRLNLMNRFFDNIKRVRNSGISISVELVANDELISEIPTIKQICLKNLGALCHVVIPRVNNDPTLKILTKLSEKEFLDTWSSFDSPLFDFKRKIWSIPRKGEFCYAGAWSGALELENGNLYQCHCGALIQNLYEDIETPLNDLPVGTKCSLAHCYNGHAFLGFGDIPEMGITPTYAEFRDRVCKDGTHWLTPRIQAFFKTKLYDSNKKWSKLKKFFYNKLGNK